MKIVRLTQDHIFKPFDCGEADLNDFFLQDAKQYLKGLLAVTYLVEDESSTVAFFSLSNDRISLAESDKATWRRIRSSFPHRKHRSDYPAVKIGRLGFYEGNGFKPLRKENEGDTIPMYYDLTQLI